MENGKSICIVQIARKVSKKYQKNMSDEVFIKKSKQYQKELKYFISKNFGRKCGHIGKDQISLDCVVCKSWLTYEFYSWFLDTVEDLS